MKSFKQKSLFNYHLSIYQILSDFGFRLGYSHDKGEEYKSIIYLQIFFWSIEINF